MHGTPQRNPWTQHANLAGFSVLTLGQQRLRLPRCGRRQRYRRYGNKPSRRGELSWRLAAWSATVGTNPFTFSPGLVTQLKGCRESIELQLTLSYPGTSRLGTSRKPPNRRELHVPGEGPFPSLRPCSRKRRRAKGKRCILSSFSLTDPIPFNFLFSPVSHLSRHIYISQVTRLVTKLAVKIGTKIN